MNGITNPAEEYFKDGLWGWVTDQWKKLVATAGGALHIYIAGQVASVMVKQTTPDDMTVACHGWTGTLWRKLPMVWGYSGRWAEREGYKMLADAAYVFDTVAVPADYVYKVEAASIHNNTGVRGTAFVAIRSGGTSYNLVSKTTPAIQEPTAWLGELTLAQGDQLRLYQNDCLTDDEMRACVWGYKMKIAE